MLANSGFLLGSGREEERMRKMDKTSVRVTAISCSLAVVILTVGVSGFALANSWLFPSDPQKAEWVAGEAERDAAEDAAEAEYAARVGDPEAAEEAREAEESAREAAAAQRAYEDAVAAQQNAPAPAPAPAPEPAPAPAPEPQAPAAEVFQGDDRYKQEGGVVYEYDDGGWEPEYDKKIEGGVVYEYDDGRWEPDDDWDDDWDDWDDDDD